MNKLLSHRYVLRQNLITLIGICLCIYFVYHTVQGNRSLLRLVSLNQSIETMSLEHDSLNAERLTIERQVTMMRPGSINKDLLEERARLVLGYSHEDEITILQN